VDEDGRVHSSGPVIGPDGPKSFLFFGIREWRFKLPEKNGKPTPFTATLEFIAP
jgi:hypothetical protein